MTRKKTRQFVTQTSGVDSKGNKLALRIFWITACSATGLFLIIWLPGQVKYLVAEVQCGHAPYAVEPMGPFDSGGWYVFPGDHYTKSIRNTYYCNKDQAVSSGRGRDIYAEPR